MYSDKFIFRYKKQILNFLNHTLIYHIPPNVNLLYEVVDFSVLAFRLQIRIDGM